MCPEAESAACAASASGSGSIDVTEEELMSLLANGSGDNLMAAENTVDANVSTIPTDPSIP